MGEEARHMIGRTPAISWPFARSRRGVIADYDITEVMLKTLSGASCAALSSLFNPRVILCCRAASLRWNAVQWRRRAQCVAARRAVDGRTHGGAIGAGLTCTPPAWQHDCDIGGGRERSCGHFVGRLVTARSLRVGGKTISTRRSWTGIRREYNMMTGERTAEIKIRIGSVYPVGREHHEVRGRAGQRPPPCTITIGSTEIVSCSEPPPSSRPCGRRWSRRPPELGGTSWNHYAFGGTAALGVIGRSDRGGTGMPVHLAENPLTASSRARPW